MLVFTAAVIDKADTLPSHLSVCCTVGSSDKARTEAAAQAVQKQDFVWVQLHALNQRTKSNTANTGEEKITAKSREEKETAASVRKTGDSDEEKEESVLREGEKEGEDLIKVRSTRTLKTFSII